MRNSDWNNHNSHTHRHHCYSQTTSSPSSSGHMTSSLPATHQYNSKSGWTYGLNPCDAECSRSSEDAGSNFHATAKIKTSLAKSKIPISIRHNDLDYTTTGSSSIASSTTVSENLHRKLIPFITTTSWFSLSMFQIR